MKRRNFSDCKYELGARVAAYLRKEQRHKSNTTVRFSEDLAIDYSAHTVAVALPKLRFYLLEPAYRQPIFR